jgi:hypothetical protein
LIASGIITQHLRNIFFTNDITEGEEQKRKAMTGISVISRAMILLIIVMLKMMTTKDEC